MGSFLVRRTCPQAMNLPVLSLSPNAVGGEGRGEGAHLSLVHGKGRRTGALRSCAPDRIAFISSIDPGELPRREFVQPKHALAKRHLETIGAGSRPAKSLLAIAAAAFSLLRHRLC